MRCTSVAQIGLPVVRSSVEAQNSRTDSRTEVSPLVRKPALKPWSSADF